VDNTKTIRYGIIGTGLMGCEHIRNLAAIPGTAVTAIADPHLPSREAAQACLPKNVEAPAEFHDFHDLLRSNLVDAVVVCTPNFTHIDVLNAIFTVAPTLHVLVEKPLCTTIADAKQVVERSATHKGIVWMGLEYRFMPPVARFLRELTIENIGSIKMISIREHRYPFLIKVGDWNRFSVNTGGTLVEKCCHFFDLMNLAVGARPVKVYASGGQDVNHLSERYPGNVAGEVPDILDNAFVVVDYANGARGLLDLCMFAEASTNEQELVAVGDRGKVESKVTQGTVIVGRRGQGRIDGRPGEPTMIKCDASKDDRVAHVGYHHGSSYLEHLGFLDAIRNATRPAVTVEEGLWSVAVGIAAHISIAEDRPVFLSELGLS
jgi:myo-inositol 2-dehydrogenase / D-chiro-inositol 1-dehydrogenase